MFKLSALVWTRLYRLPQDLFKAHPSRQTGDWSGGVPRCSYTKQLATGTLPPPDIPQAQTRLSLHLFPRSTDLPSPHSVLPFKDYCALLFSHPHITHNKWAPYFLLSPPLLPPLSFIFFLSLTRSLSLLHSVPMKGRHWAGSGIPKPQASAPLCLAIQHCWEPLV